MARTTEETSLQPYKGRGEKRKGKAVKRDKRWDDGINTAIILSQLAGQHLLEKMSANGRIAGLEHVNL